MRAGFFIAAVLLALPVYADENNCRDITDSTLRLQCFDDEAQQQKVTSENLFKKTPPVSAPEDQFSLLNERWELEQDLVQFAFRPYRPVYFLPLFYSTSLNTQPQTPNPRTTVDEAVDLDHTEAKLQLSFKTKLLNDLIGDNGDLWFGYTQSSRWQVFNVANSRPFRETNHEPEFIFVWRTHYDIGAFSARMMSLSLTHQSNGREEPLSRSWNRLILTLGFDRPDWVIQLRPWYRIPETSSAEDENPDILDYIGRGEILVVHRKKNSHQISAQIRHTLKGGDTSRGSFNLDWSYPCFDRLRCHAQIFRGYGESLIDYNHLTTSIGLGVALVEWY